MNDRQKRFADKYLACGNASEAYRYAYKCKSNNIDFLASQLLKKDYIQDYITQQRQHNERNAEISRAEMIRLCVDMLSVNQTDYYDKKGQPKEFDKLTEAEKACVSEIKHIISGGKLLVVYKTYDKIRLMERISKMLGFDITNLQGSVGVHQDEAPKHTLEEIRAERERLNKALKAIKKQ